jgi:hypothetical protein
MWISSKILGWLEVSRTAYDDLKVENSTLKTELVLTKADLTATRINSDWLRLKVNDLELTNKALLEKAYDIRLPVPTIVRETSYNDPNPYKLPQALFEHIDEETAKALGDLVG